MRIKEAGKKVRSILYIALGNEEKRIFGQKFTKSLGNTYQPLLSGKRTSHSKGTSC